MAIREIIRMGHPTLRQVARKVDRDEIGSDSFNSLIDDMRETLHTAGGIGLAAPQINESLQLAVIEIASSTTRYGEIPTIPFTVYINPTIEVIEPEVKGYWEACLSVPGLMGYVERPQHIRVSYLNQQAENQSQEFKGFSATVFQHEFDHLNGRLYVDRIRDLSLLAFEEEYHDYHQQETE